MMRERFLELEPRTPQRATEKPKRSSPSSRFRLWKRLLCEFFCRPEHSFRHHVHETEGITVIYLIGLIVVVLAVLSFLGYH